MRPEKNEVPLAERRCSYINTTLAHHGIAGCAGTQASLQMKLAVTSASGIAWGMVALRGYCALVSLGDSGRWDMKARLPGRTSDSSGAKGDEVENSRELLLRRHAGCV
jgi:hypothetical protein